jgi:glyoxylase-like metal-dependent hydrolase (beta-lactamase superfamily II)
MNCYIAAASEAAEGVIVIDPGDRCEKILAKLAGRQVYAIILTHRHSDHTAAASQLAAATGAPIYAHELDADAIEFPKEHYPKFSPEKREPPKLARRLRDGDVIEHGGIRLEVISTPGHSSGSICLLAREDMILFSGDTLFEGTTGRTDFETGSPAEMHASLRRLAQLDDGVLVLPGHDRPTTIGDERSRALVEY